MVNIYLKFAHLVYQSKQRSFGLRNNYFISLRNAKKLLKKKVKKKGEETMKCFPLVPSISFSWLDREEQKQRKKSFFLVFFLFVFLFCFVLFFLMDILSYFIFSEMVQATSVLFLFLVIAPHPPIFFLLLLLLFSEFK